MRQQFRDSGFKNLRCLCLVLQTWYECAPELPGLCVVASYCCFVSILLLLPCILRVPLSKIGETYADKDALEKDGKQARKTGRCEREVAFLWNEVRSDRALVFRSLPRVELCNSFLHQPRNRNLTMDPHSPRRIAYRKSSSCRAFVDPLEPLQTQSPKTLNPKPDKATPLCTRDP